MVRGQLSWPAVWMVFVTKYLLSLNNINAELVNEITQHWPFNNAEEEKKLLLYLHDCTTCTCGEGWKKELFGR